jgi:Zn-dependent protease
MDLSSNALLEIILVLVPMLLCLTVHEYAHARAALWLGDDTASLQGRLTLNPVSHIDIFGTILLPILFVLSNSSFFFGWAKPVPVNPVRFVKRFNGARVSMATGMMITAAAGPLSNLVFGFLSGVLLKLALLAGIESEPVLMILAYLMMVNYGLGIFNMIPLPPLDGSKVLAGVLPRDIAKYFDYLEHNTFVSFIILIALLRTGVLGKVMGPVFGWLLKGTSAILDLPFF